MIVKHDYYEDPDFMDLRLESQNDEFEFEFKGSHQSLCKFFDFIDKLKQELMSHDQ